MSGTINLTELLCCYKDILGEIIQLIGANCWRLALVNSELLRAVKAILPSLNLRIQGMCCYYKSPAIMFGILERVSQTKLNLYAINCYMKKTFVCTVQNIGERAYVNINNHVISFPCESGINDDGIVKNLSVNMENTEEFDPVWMNRTVYCLQDKSLTTRGFLNCCRIYNSLPDENQRMQRVMRDLKSYADFPDFLGIKVQVFNYFTNGEKIVYDTSIGAIVKYYYTIPGDQFPVLAF